MRHFINSDIIKTLLENTPDTVKLAAYELAKSYYAKDIEREAKEAEARRSVKPNKARDLKAKLAHAMEKTRISNKPLPRSVAPKQKNRGNLPTLKQIMTQPATYPFKGQLNKTLANKSSPPPPLVGVELNPGPKNGRNKKSAKPKRAHNHAGVGKFTAKTKSAPVSKASIITRGKKAQQTEVFVNDSEFVSEVNGSTNFTLNSLGTFTATNGMYVHPTNVNLFPQLSRTAQNFEHYRFSKLILRYEPETSTATTGYVAISANYDCKAPVFTTKQQMSVVPGFMKTAPWQKASWKMDLTSLVNKWMLCAPNTLPTSADPAFYYAALLCVATGGQGGSPPTNMGDLYVDYRCHLKTPVTTAIAGLMSTAQVNSLTVTGVPTSTTTPWGAGVPTYQGISIKDGSGVMSNSPFLFTTGSNRVVPKQGTSGFWLVVATTGYDTSTPGTNWQVAGAGCCAITAVAISTNGVGTGSGTPRNFRSIALCSLVITEKPNMVSTTDYFSIDFSGGSIGTGNPTTSIMIVRTPEGGAGAFLDQTTETIDIDRKLMKLSASKKKKLCAIAEDYISIEEIKE